MSSELTIFMFQAFVSVEECLSCTTAQLFKNENDEAECCAANKERRYLLEVAHIEVFLIPAVLKIFAPFQIVFDEYPECVIRGSKGNFVHESERRLGLHRLAYLRRQDGVLG